ncbi:hypothetical protein BT69DRAFT_1342927, partial [Atractiella rhizophila]
MSQSYHAHLPDLSTPRFQALAKSDCFSHAAAFKERKQPPWLHALWEHWKTLYQEPLVGVTSDGTVKDGLYDVGDEEFNVRPVVEAAKVVLSKLNDEERSKSSSHIDSPDWRT